MPFDPDSINRLRKTLELSLEEFAQRIGITRQHLANYEYKKTMPPVTIIDRMEQTFGVSYRYFFKDRLTATHTNESESQYTDEH